MRKGLKIYSCWAALLLLFMFGLAPAIDQAPQFPSPGVIDMVTHDRGNLQTTIHNYGYVGGYYWAGYPSGRWPASSQNDYLAEMKFWIGGVNAAGDTVLANTDDDFNPIPSYIAGNLTHDIRLSTDSLRYDYDVGDTVGEGIGRPAYGWRVWDVVTRDWVYNQVYNPQDDQFYDGGPLGVQESICRYADDALGYPVMGLEITQTVRQWNYKYNKDMIFFTLEITNASAEDLTSVAIGLYCDFDVGGVDPSTGENGRLGDLVAHDATRDLAWTYDEDGYDPGWGPSVTTGYMGTVILSTPGDVGMTSFNTGQWEYLPQTDLERFRLIDNTEFDTSLPPTDQYYVQAVRGIDLPAGATVQFDFALVAGHNEEALLINADRARSLFASYYVGPEPPAEPIVSAKTGDQSVLISWSDASESSVDPFSGSTDFMGYKVYRSDDRGETWGTLQYNAIDETFGPDYVPLAHYWLDGLGRIEHVFVDSNLTNGMEYWYTVVAYDSGSALTERLQNDKGTPESVDNTVSVVPRDDPLGYHTPQSTIEHTYTGTYKENRGTVNLYLIDEAAVTGDDYKVSFYEDCAYLYWYLINTTTGDTVLADQTQTDGFTNQPTADGFQVVLNQPSRWPENYGQSGFAVPDSVTGALYVEPFSSDVGCGEHYRGDFEIRFTATGSVAYEWFTQSPMSVPFEIWNVWTNSQVACWVVDWSGDGQWTMADLDYIVVTNYPYNAGAAHPDSRYDYINWVSIFIEKSMSDLIPPPYAIPEGDVFTILGPRRFSPDDEYTFSSRKVVADEVSSNLDRIRVVPNPYLGYAAWDGGPGDRKIQFVNLPEDCTVRIYTLAGEIVRTLTNDADGSVDWDLLSEAGRGIASGVYLYHVESGNGNYTGKFAVIK